MAKVSATLAIATWTSRLVARFGFLTATIPLGHENMIAKVLLFFPHHASWACMGTKRTCAGLSYMLLTSQVWGSDSTVAPRANKVRQIASLFTHASPDCHKQRCARSEYRHVHHKGSKSKGR